MADTALISVIDRALKDLQYGTVQIVVHEGKLVRVERIERLRIPSDQTMGSTAYHGDQP